MSREFRSALDGLIEQQERMRRVLEPEYLRSIDTVHQVQQLAQPMMDVVSAAEQAMRSLGNATKLTEDVARQLAAAPAFDNRSLALENRFSAELEAAHRALSGCGVLGHVKTLDDLTSTWRATFAEVDTITKALSSSFVEVGPSTTDVTSKMAQLELVGVANAWKAIESGLSAVGPEVADQLRRPFTDTISDTLRQIEALSLPRLDASVYAALQATAKSFPDIGSLVAGLQVDGIDFGINGELARAVDHFAEAAREAVHHKETADLEDLIVQADAVVAAAMTGEQRQVLSPLVRIVLLTIILNVVGSWTTEGLNAIFRGLLPYLVAIVVGVPAPAVLPTTSLTVPGIVAPAPPVDSGSLLSPRDWQVEGLPPIIRRAGPAAERQTLEFFASRARNPNTRQAYATAIVRFMTWCEDRELELSDITTFNVTAYVEEMQADYAPATVSQHLAAIRTLFDYFVVAHVLRTNPAKEVRGLKPTSKKARTPPLQPAAARQLLESIEVTDLAGLRDRALIAVMMYGCARVSAVVTMDVRDYHRQRGQWWMRVHERGGRAHELPVHPQGQKFLNSYIAAGGLKNQLDSPLWRTVTRHCLLNERRMSRVDIFRMVRRRSRAANLGEKVNCHTLRATGITSYMRNGGALERAQALAGHDSPGATRRYAPLTEDITVADISRIAF